MIKEIIGAILLSFFFQFSFIKINKSVVKYEKLITGIITYALVLLIGYRFMNITRLVFSFILLSMINKIIHGEKMFKTLMLSFFCFVIIAISEVLIMIFLTILNVENIQKLYGSFILNIAVFVIAILLTSAPKMVVILRNNFSVINEYTGRKIYLLFLVIFSNFILLIHYLYFDGSKLLQIIIYVFAVISIVFLYSGVIKNKIEKEEITKKYFEIENSILEYEKHLEELRIANHENINNLVIIKDMTVNKKIQRKIDLLLKSSPSSNLLNELPLGGIRGIVGYKREAAIAKKIDFSLYVQPKLKIKRKDEIGQLLAIYLDNAIDASNLCEKGTINVGFYRDEIVISNSYSGIVDFTNNRKGYSTKGKNRGYGLHLADKIVRSANLIIEKEIDDLYKIKIRNF